MVIFLILDDIFFINNILTNYFKEDVINLFLDGYCLEYYLILKYLYDDAQLVIEKNKNHCACLINNCIYDVSGIRESNDFFIASKRDEDFVFDFYKKFSYVDKNNIYKIIKIYKQNKTN